MRNGLANEQLKSSCAYLDVPGDPGHTGVSRNKLNLTAHSKLRPAEYALTNIRLIEITEERGPSGNFDKAHRKAIHDYIFQDFYEWAGHTRNESPSLMDSGSSQSVAFPRAARPTCPVCA